jgi:hypothetical protein
LRELELEAVKNRNLFLAK